MADFASTGRFEKISEHKYKYISDGANFTIEGENFDPNVVKITNNVPIDGGFKIGMSGLNGNVIINGVPTGVFGDNKYVIHGNVYPNSADVMAVIGIGNGATVKGTDGVVVDDNSTVYIGKGSHRLSTITQVQSLNFTVVNFKDDFTLRTINDKFNFAGLPDNYAVTLSAGGNIGEKVNFQTGGRGTISVGDTSLIINGDTNFDLKLQNGSIASLENFDGACSIVGSDGVVSDYFVETAIQHKEVVLDTKENFATTELSNKLGIKTKVYYTNNDKGGVIDVSNQNLNGEILVAMGKASTIIGSKGNDNLIGRAADSYLVGGAGNDTFRGGAGFRKITVADYVEGEDVVFHGSSFKEVSPLSMAKLDGNDFALSIGPVATVVKNGADKKIKMIDSTGEVTYVGNYWQVQDFDPEKITSTPNVNIIDATDRTKDVILIGNDKDNTIISGAGNSTLTGGGGKNTFIVRGNAVITDLGEDDKVYKSSSWEKVGKNAFKFSGFDKSDPATLVEFTISGKGLKDVDNDGAPDGVSIEHLSSVKNYGVAAALNGLSGEVSLNGKPLGISKDSDYDLHFSPIISPNIPANQKSGAEALRFLKISPGAKISAQYAWVSLEGDGTYFFADGDYRVSTTPLVIGNPHLQNIKINNGGKGLKINVKNGAFVPVEGLSIVSGAVAQWGNEDMFEDTFKEDYFGFDDFSLLTQSAESVMPEDTFDELASAVVDFIDDTFVAEEE